MTIVERKWFARRMGAWGEGPFANDDAADFLGDLNGLQSEVEMTGALLEPCRRVLTAGYLESPAVCEAIAAAVLLAVRAGAPAPLELTNVYQLTPLALGTPPIMTPDLRRLALDVLDRSLLAEDNEWYELWDEAGLINGVTATLKHYRDHLISSLT